jgi:hypothetical protein
MSKLKRAYQAFSPFPKKGLTKDYERFIRQEVNDYCKQYPDVRKEEMLAEAVKIAVEFEPKFKSGSGYDFSTPLRHHLKGLHRFAQREFSSWRIGVDRVALAANKLEAKRNGIGGDDPRPVNFAGMGNGARTAFDFQWTTGTPMSNLVVIYTRDHDPTTMLHCPDRLDRHRVVIGHTSEMMEGANLDVKVVLADREPSPITHGYLRAVMDHNERRQREADAEAENRRLGSYEPVFLVVYAQKYDIEFYKGRSPPEFKPDYIQHVSLSEPIVTDADDGHVGTLADTIADESLANAASDHADQLRNAAETDRLRAIVDAERMFMSPKEATVLDHRLMANRPIAEVADRVGMTKGGVSKMATRLADRLRAKK